MVTVTEFLELAEIGCCAFCNASVVQSANGQVLNVKSVSRFGLMVEAGDDFCEVAGFHSGPGPVPSVTERREHIRALIAGRGWTAEIEQEARRQAPLVLEAMGLPVPPLTEVVR